MNTPVKPQRKILFRAKQFANTKDWVYGGYAQYNDEAGLIVTCYERTRQKKYHIIPKTAGQYVGLSDLNHNLIFEGDILGHTYEQNTATVEWNDFLAQFQATWNNMPTTAADIRHLISLGYEVIGNVHDNPELLTLVKKTPNLNT